jgi:hypothetical protein
MMCWPVLLYFVMSAAIAISSGIHAGFWVAMHAFGASFLALVAGGGLRASLHGDKTQKIGGGIIAILLLLLALWIAEGFSVTLFGIGIPGAIWCAIGLMVCLMFGDKS